MLNDPNDARPIFLQIAELLEDAIISGAYAEESQVPSITEFAGAYKINPATALKGVNLLVDSDLLYKKRGLGMFVAPGARDKLLEQRRQRFAADYLRPLLIEARRLGLSIEQVVMMLQNETSEG